MKMVLIVYSGTRPTIVPDLLDAHEAGGYTELSNTHGAGVSGKRAGTRAWPGGATVYFSIVPEERADGLARALREHAERMEPGERLHGAVLPVETFF